MRKIKSLYYHDPSPSGFERMICYCQKRGYRFISLDDLYCVLMSKESVTEKLAFISLDDGWRGNLNLLPIIEKYNVPICVFVATGPLESGNFWWEYVREEYGVKKMFDFKKLSYVVFCEELQKIKLKYELDRSALTVKELVYISEHPLVTIQSHTVNHPILTNVPEDVLEKELLESQKTLEKLTNQKVYAFSYPNGSLSKREVDACKRHYKLAFSVEQNHISRECDLFLLPRYALTGQYHRDLLKLFGIWKYLKMLVDYFQ